MSNVWPPFCSLTTFLLLNFHSITLTHTVDMIFSFLGKWQTLSAQGCLSLHWKHSPSSVPIGKKSNGLRSGKFEGHTVSALNEGKCLSNVSLNYSNTCLGDSQCCSILLKPYWNIVNALFPQDKNIFWITLSFFPFAFLCDLSRILLNTGDH